MSQMGSVSGWYTNAYSGPFRTARLRAPSLVPSRSVVIPAQQTLVVDVAHNHPHQDDENAAGGRGGGKVKRRETIFGPDVGEDDEPGWTEEKREEVGMDVVKGWVENAKSEEGLHATTTLQALVNLKRPTLLLQQIESAQPASPTAPTTADAHTYTNPYAPTDPDAITPAPVSPTSASHYPSPPLHILKFAYDATTPCVRVTLEVYPTPQPAVEGKESIVEDHEPRVVYSGLHEGGFNQMFELPREAAMDLSSAINAPPEEAVEDDEKEGKEAPAEGEYPPPPGVPPLPRQPGVPAPVDAEPDRFQDEQPRRRFGLFGRRNREEDIESQLAQIEMTNQINGLNPDAEAAEKEEKKEIEQGMRILIKIDGVGPEGEPLKRRNAQLTHILINGTWVADNNASADAGQAPGKRVWVVKVARREAVIGAHTFLLKEIYGLSSASTTTTAPAYPPTADDPYSSTPNECIVCLTSPRDVVLLPCRHLVVCRECAVGMVEFGAGGKVARREETETGDGAAGGAVTGAGAGGGTGGDGAAGGAAGSTQVAGGTTTTGRERRKKKVKGWYCPVCRQPYTSLLRLALPDASKQPEHTHGNTRPPSRAASVRTFRSGRAPSLAPTLPDGAERMLEALRPDGGRDSDEDEDDVNGVDGERVQERPQFVVGEEDKDEVEHRENAGAPAHAPATAGHGEVVGVDGATVSKEGLKQ
ncbi:hypothetical protein IAT38_002818 [Cryptococcus sp. DSM 104549]